MADVRSTLLSPEQMGTFDAEGNYHPRPIVDDDLADKLGSEHPGLAPVDADPAWDRLLELYREALDERVEVACVGT